MTPPRYDPRYLAGLRLYYLARYWDSHEQWEEIWREAAGVTRHFYQALIQLDAALIHTERGHWAGVANLLARGLGHLEHCPNYLMGIDITRLRDQLRVYREAVLALNQGQKQELDRSLCPDLAVEGVNRETLIAMEDENAAHSLG